MWSFVRGNSGEGSETFGYDSFTGRKTAGMLKNNYSRQGTHSIRSRSRSHWNVSSLLCFQCEFCVMVIETFVRSFTDRKSRTIDASTLRVYNAGNVIGFGIISRLVIFESSKTGTEDPWLQSTLFGRIFTLRSFLILEFSQQFHQGWPLFTNAYPRIWN